MPHAATRFNAAGPGVAPLTSTEQSRINGLTAASQGRAISDPDQTRQKQAPSDTATLHDDAAAHEAAEMLGADAFTLGNDIYLSAAAGRAGGINRQALLRHELVHVAQHLAAPSSPSAPGDAPGLPPPRPPAPARAVAGPYHPLERAALNQTCQDTPTPAGLILRMPSHLPATAGGQALNRHLRGEDDQNFDDILTQISANDFISLSIQDPHQRPAYEDPVSRISEEFPVARAEIWSIGDAIIRARMMRDFNHDFACLIYSKFYDETGQTFEEFEADVTDVMIAYSNFVTLYRMEHQQADAVSPYGPMMPNWFETRATVFRDAALRESAAPLYAVFAGLAADIASAEQQDLQGPVRAAKMLIGHLFEEGISPGDMDAVAQLYRTVLEGLDQTALDAADPENAHWRFEILRDYFVSEHLSLEVLAVETLLIAAGDEDATTLFRQNIGDEIARYLATLTEDGFTGQTQTHLERLIALLGVYQVQPFVSDYMDTSWTVDDVVDEDDRGNTLTPDTYGPGPSQARVTPPAAEPEEEICEGEVINLQKILEWLKMRTAEPDRFGSRWNNVTGLVCANRPYSDSPANSDVRTNLAAMTQEARIVLRRLNRQITQVRHRANAIKTARQGDPNLYGPPTAEQAAEMEAEIEEPDLIDDLRYDNEFYSLFQQALTRGSGGFDASTTGESLSETALTYFETLTYYQLSLKAAVDLRNQMATDGMDLFIRGLGVAEHATLLDRIEGYANQTEDFPPWPAYQSTIDKANEIDLAVIRMEGIRNLAQGDRDLDNIEAIQADIFINVPLAALQKRTSAIGGEGDSRRYDFLNRSDIFLDPLRGMLASGWENYEADALITIDAALDLVNQGRLSDLAAYARGLAEAGDALESEEALGRFGRLNSKIRNREARAQNTGGRTPQDDLLARFGAEDPSAAFTAGLQSVNFAATQHLLQLFLMVETARSGASGDARGPGRIIRQVNLLMILLDESPQKTLAGALDRLDNMFTPIRLAQNPERVKHLLRGLDGNSNSELGLYDDFTTALSPLLSVFSSVTAAAGPAGALFFETTYDVLRSAREGGVLHTLVQAEAAGGLDERAPYFEQLADELREAGGTGAVTTARFIYADIMGVANLIDEMGMPRNVLDAQSRQNKRRTTMMSITHNPDGTPAPSPEADAATVAEYNREGTAAMATLEAGNHPTANRPLNASERRVFGKYREITGEDHWHGVGDEDLLAVSDFAKQIAKMAVVIFVTRGIGSGAAAATGRQFLGTVANMGAFTAIMRAESTLSTGQYPHTSFAEDMIINLATEGIGQGTQVGYRALFGVGRNTARIGGRHAAGMFVAEMATTSVASMIAAGVTARIFDRSFSNSQMRSALVDNAAMMVAMRGVHVLGARATDYINRRLQDAALREQVNNVDLEALQQNMVRQDVAIREAATTMLDKTSDADRMAVLEDQLGAMERKLAILDGSSNREVRMLAESYRQGVRTHRRSVMQTRLHIRINAREAGPLTPDQTYAPGRASESELARHLTESGNPFSVRPTVFGAVFEVTLPNGTRIHYRPRRNTPAGASRAGSYTNAARIEGAEISARDPSQLMSILHGDNLSHRLLKRRAVGNTLAIGTGSHVIQTEFLPVERHSNEMGGSGAAGPHAAGPARFELSIDANGNLRAVVELRNDVSNDQIVRAVNEEIRELQQISTVIGDRTNPASQNFIGPLSALTLDTIVTEQSAAGRLRRGGNGTGPLTADDGATIRGVGFLGKRLAQLSDRINDPATPEGDRSELYARRDLVLADFQALWAEVGLPTDRARLNDIVQQLDDAGMALPEAARGYLEGMRFTRAGHPQLDSPVTMLDLHILFSELQKANPHRFGGVTIRDFMNYYHDAIARRAKSDYDTAIQEGRSAEEAADAQITTILNLIGGTSIPSARGRNYEGVSLEQFNRNIGLLNQYGRMYGIERNNFPTYDAVTVQGAANGFTMREIDIPGPGGTDVRHLQLIDADGTVFFQCHRGPNGGLIRTVNIRYDVLMWSMKARQTVDTFQILKATGFSRGARRIGRMFLSEEGSTALDARVSWYNLEVSRLQALGANQPGHTDNGRFRLMRWRASILSRVAGQTQRGGTNRSIDALIQTVRAETLDANDVEIITD